MNASIVETTEIRTKVATELTLKALEKANIKPPDGTPRNMQEVGSQVAELFNAIYENLRIGT